MAASVSRRSGASRRSRPLLSALMRLVLCALLLLPALSAWANPQVPQGGSASFANTGGGYHPGPTWAVSLSGSTIATSTSPGGWSVSYGTQFTVGAPASATIATGYFVVYNNSGSSGPTASFDVVAGGAPAALSGLSLSPNAVVGGNTGGTQSTGTVSLSAAAPSGGAVVYLTSSNTGVATVPSSVTVAAGQTSNTFTVTTSAVTTQTSVTISALYSSVTKTATLTVSPWLNALSLSPTSAISGGSSTGTVSLNAAAPTGGLTVALSSDNTSVATVPASVTVPAGQSTATFTVSAGQVTSNASATITATYSGQSLTASLSVQPLLSGLSLSPSSVTGGSPSTGTVSLSAPAPSGGTTVSLSSANSAATVPSSVTVAAGQNSATFTVTTSAVTTVTSGNIAAAYGGVTRTAGLTVNPLQVSLSVSPASVVGGAPATGTVTLNGPAPSGGISVALSSSSTAASVPASVSVAGGATSATFTVTTSAVTTSTTATLTASYGGLSSQASLTVQPLLNGLSISPTSVVGGNPATGTVTLYGPAPSGGISVALSSSNTGAATVPSSVTVAAGQTQATFTVTTSAVTTDTGVTLTAGYGGATATATLTVQPLLASLSLNPTTVYGGGTSTGTVTLNGPAPSGGVTIALASDNTAVATVPASVTVAGGATSGTFTVSTSAVSASSGANISASYGGKTASQSLTVVPLLAAVSVSPSTILAGGTGTGTVSLNGPAPTGGISVALSSSNTGVATVPASVSVAGGQTSATFTVTGAAVTASATTTISASYGGVTQTAQVTVAPLLSGLSVSPTQVVGGDPATGTVTFSVAPPNGTVISLSSSNSAAASVPASLTTTGGGYNMSAQFPVTTSAVTAVTPVTLSATYGGKTVSATLTVRPVPTVQSVAADPAEMFYNPTVVYGSGGGQHGGPTSTGTVTLSGVAPAAGAVVTLSSSNTGAATVPASVTVAGGQTQATFSIGITAVAADTGVTLTAGYNSSSATGLLTVDRPRLQGLTFSPSTLGGGSTTTATLTLNGTAPTGGVAVNLACDTPGGASFPAQVTIPAGSATYDVPIVTSTVNDALTLTFTATNAAFPADPPVTATVSVLVATLHNVDLYMPKAVHLEWYLSSVGDFLLKRDGVALTTLPNTAMAYDDTFNWTSGQTYQYDLYDNNVPSAPVLLSTERVTPYLDPATQDQAVDSRLDLRYSTNVFLDHQFGAGAYKGGLFTGFASDPSKIGRSFARFAVTPAPSGGVFRTGKVNAYFVTADTPNNAGVSLQVGCQALGSATWDAPTFTWDAMLTAFPGFSAAAAPRTVTLAYDPKAPWGLQATSGSGQVTLAWNPPPANTPVASYTVTYSAQGGYPSQITGITGTGTTVTGLSNGTPYTFAVAAVDSTNATGPNSAAVSSVPGATARVTTAPPGINAWYSWPLRADIEGAARATNHTLNVGWASMAESTPGWAYLAKTEYDATLGPSVMHAWSLPTLISLQAPGSVSLGGGTTATGIVTVNAIGLTGSATVALSSSNTAVATVPSSLTVTGLTRTFTISIVGTGTTTLTASFGGITKQVTMTVGQ